MMQKRSLYSLLLVSFIALFAVSSVLADAVVFESKNAARCKAGTQNISVTVDPGDSVTAVEIVYELVGSGATYTSYTVSWDPGFLKLTDRVINLSQANGTLPDTIRMAAMLLTPSAGALGAGTHVVGRINFTTSDNCTGTITARGIAMNYAGGSCGFGCGLTVPVIQSQTVKQSTTTVVAATVTQGVVTLLNSVPTINDIPNQTVAWGTPLLGVDANGSDADLANGCESLTYSVAGPAGMTINPTTGVVSWTPTGAQVCTHNVTVTVTDECGASANDAFVVCVTNEEPVLACPTDTAVVIAGDLFTSDVNATDADGGPNPLLYSLISFTGPGTFLVNPANGNLSWQTLTNDPAYTGLFAATIKVTDGANLCDPCSPSNADTCVVWVSVKSMQVTIEKVHDQIQGVYTTVDISMLPSAYDNFEIAGFSLLIQYDNSAMSFQMAAPGEFLTDCGWEYFTYRTGPFGNCGTGCPTGLVQIVAIAETNNGNNFADCFVNTGGISEVLATLTFLVSNDRTLECQFAPIKFFWLDCTDNTFSSIRGDSLFISRDVYDYAGSGGVDTYTLITNEAYGFPGWYGASDACEVSGGPGKPEPIRLVDFRNGGIDIVCADSIDARGDVNLNGVANEIADVVMFTNYFIIGLDAFDQAGGNVQGSIAATEINGDGAPLTVADLVYLIRIIVGDALPLPKTSVVTVQTYVDGSVYSVEAEMGAAFMVMKGEVTPTLLAENMTMISSFDGANTRILIYPPVSEGMKHMETFSGAFLSVPGEMLSIEMATPEGFVAKGNPIPTAYELDENYPNPFNPSTTIGFSLPVAGNYSLTIYNVSGQRVAEFSGSEVAGKHTVTWRADNVASGVYFYKLVAGSFTDTKKMVLLK